MAIVGASDNIARIGGRPLRYLLQYAKDVAVYPVKPGSNEIQGVRSFPSLRDLPEKVDLCIFATPAEISVEEFNAYAGESFRSALIFSGGFSESVAEGMALQERLKTIADARNVPVLGPNCLGFASIKSRVFGTLASAFEELKIEAGSTAILSQGGGFAINLLVEAATRKVKLSRMLSTGNEVNVDIADLMNFLAEDPLTSQVIAIIEGVRDGNRLGAAMARLREAGKPLYVLKIGRSKAGAQSVRSHTAIAAGNDAAFGALLERYGVSRLRTINEAIDVMQVRQRPDVARPIIVATMSGGTAGYMADLCDDFGLSLKPLAKQVSDELEKILPSYGAVLNPIDLTGQVINDTGLLERCMSLLMSKDQENVRIALFLGGMGDRAPNIIGTLAELQQKCPNEFAISWLGVDEKIRQSARDRGLCVFDDPARLLAAWGAVDAGLHSGAPDDNAESSEEGNSYVIGESVALAWVRDAGIPVPGTFEADSIASLVAQGPKLRFPVVMKVTEPLIAHRAKVGGVLLDVQGVEELAAGWEVLQEKVAATKVIVAEQVHSKDEILVGLLRDASFGSTAVIGSGGVDTNQKNSHRKLIPPFDTNYLRSELSSLPEWVNWVATAEDEMELISQLIGILEKLGKILFDQPYLMEIEINPVLVTTTGLIAVDALAIARSDTA